MDSSPSNRKKVLVPGPDWCITGDLKSPRTVAESAGFVFGTPVGMVLYPIQDDAVLNFDKINRSPG